MTALREPSAGRVDIASTLTQTLPAFGQLQTNDSLHLVAASRILRANRDNLPSHLKVQYGAHVGFEKITETVLTERLDKAARPLRPTSIRLFRHQNVRHGKPIEPSGADAPSATGASRHAASSSESFLNADRHALLCQATPDRPTAFLDHPHAASCAATASMCGLCGRNPVQSRHGRSRIAGFSAVLLLCFSPSPVVARGPATVSARGCTCRCSSDRQTVSCNLVSRESPSQIS